MPVTLAVIGVVLLALALAPPPANARLVPHVTPDEAAALIADRTTPLVLVMSLPSCGVCRAAIRILRDIAAEGPRQVRYAEVSLADATAIAAQFSVRAAPAELVFVDGRLVHRTAALETLAELDRALATTLP